MKNELFEYKAEVCHKNYFESGYTIKIEVLNGTDPQDAIDRFYKTHSNVEVMTIFLSLKPKGGKKIKKYFSKDLL